MLGDGDGEKGLGGGGERVGIDGVGDGWKGLGAKGLGAGCGRKLLDPVFTLTFVKVPEAASNTSWLATSLPPPRVRDPSSRDGRVGAGAVLTGRNVGRFVGGGGGGGGGGLLVGGGVGRGVGIGAGLRVVGRGLAKLVNKLLNSLSKSNAMGLGVGLKEGPSGGWKA